jgi:hypothetical protein
VDGAQERKALPLQMNALINADRDPSRRVLHDSSSDIQHFRTLKHAFENDKEIAGFGLFRDDPERRLELVQSILRHPEHYLRPVFVGDARNEYPGALVEGHFCSWEVTRGKLAQVDQMIAILPGAGDAADHDERLLRYLYVRSEARIKPVLVYGGWRIYVYPLLETLNPVVGMSTTWLSSLEGRNFGHDIELIDRIRLCSSCGSSHLNHVDRCPGCSKIAIEQTDFFHCFT